MSSSDSVRIIIGTFGTAAWVVRAKEAMISALDQTVPCEVVHVHAATLARARNFGAEPAGADWFVFLDADDTLDRGFVEAMLAGSGDLRQPATLGVYPDGREDAESVLIPPKRMIEGNYLVCGTMIRADLFHRAGGWGEEEYAEDWALFIRARLLRASVGQVPRAIYRVGVNIDGRNSQDRDRQIYWYNKIRSTYVDQARQLEAEGFVI